GAHRVGDVDAVGAVAASRQGQSVPTGTDGQLQSGSGTRQLLEDRDGRNLIAPLDVAARPRDLLAKTHDWLITLHDPLSTSPHPRTHPSGKIPAGRLRMLYRTGQRR